MEVKRSNYEREYKKIIGMMKRNRVNIKEAKFIINQMGECMRKRKVNIKERDVIDNMIGRCLDMLDEMGINTSKYGSKIKEVSKFVEEKEYMI